MHASAHGGGHWQHGAVGRGQPRLSAETEPGRAPSLVAFEDSDVTDNLWWAAERGGPGNGAHANDSMPIDPAPLVGGQNWFDNVCRVKKV